MALGRCWRRSRVFNSKMNEKKYFIYATDGNAQQARDILDKKSLVYDEFDAIQDGLKEFVFSANDSLKNSLVQEILNSSVKLHFSESKLPITGSIGAVTVSATIGDTRVGSTDGTSSNMRFIRTDADGKIILSSGASVGLDTSNNTVKLDSSNNEVKLDSSNNTVKIDSSNNVVKQNAPSTFGQGSKDVTTAGTAEALAGSTACIRAVIRAKDANTGKVYVGNSSVSSSNTGIVLNAGDAYEMELDNLNKIYIDSDTNGEGVTYSYWA